MRKITDTELIEEAKKFTTVSSDDTLDSIYRKIRHRIECLRMGCDNIEDIPIIERKCSGMYSWIQKYTNHKQECPEVI